jgi:hypothetical protein
MAKFFGVIGYASQVESTPGVWQNVIIERKYSGEILQNSRSWSASGSDSETLKVNEDVELQNRISILADIFAYSNIPYIRYIEWYGTKWTVKKAEIKRPRIILSLGGVYAVDSQVGTPLGSVQFAR